MKESKAFKILSRYPHENLIELQLPPQAQSCDVQYQKILSAASNIISKHNSSLLGQGLSYPMIYSMILKEYAQAEGVSAGFGVDLESASDLTRGIGVSETAECWEKVQQLPRGLT